MFYFGKGTQLLVEAETGNSYVVMANDTGDHEHDDEDDDHMHFDPSAHSTLRHEPVLPSQNRQIEAMIIDVECLVVKSK